MTQQKPTDAEAVEACDSKDGCGFAPYNFCPGCEPKPDIEKLDAVYQAFNKYYEAIRPRTCQAVINELRAQGFEIVRVK